MIETITIKGKYKPKKLIINSWLKKGINPITGLPGAKRIGRNYRYGYRRRYTKIVEEIREGRMTQPLIIA